MCILDKKLNTQRDFFKNIPCEVKPLSGGIVGLPDSSSLMGFTSTQVFGPFKPDKPVCLKGLSLLQAKVVQVGPSYT